MNKEKLFRVEYGKQDTPQELREYRLNGKGPVGCLKEFKEEFPNTEFEIFERCPICKNFYSGYPALSRRDNKTDICSDCGMKEALEDFVKSKTQKVFPNE